MGRSSVVERIEVEPHSLFYQEHVARYRFAGAHVQQGWTLDIACGSGYGSDMLTQYGAARIAAADVDLPALNQARTTFDDRRINFLASSGTRLPFRNDCFHNIVSLETIEHIQDDLGFLRELARVLRVDGVCLLSTPNRDYSVRRRQANPYHVREYAEDEWRQLLSQHFAQVEMYYQGFSQRHSNQVHQYAAAIQNRKRSLNPILRFGIDYCYRPVKRLIPARLVNTSIRRWLGLSYPQPETSDITISPEPIDDMSVFVAVCRKPAAA